jgi:hypothetical protein
MMSLGRRDQVSRLDILGRGAVLHLGRKEKRKGINIKNIFLKRDGGRSQNGFRCCDNQLKQRSSRSASMRPRCLSKATHIGSANFAISGWRRTII